MKTTIDHAGRLVIPREVRRQAGLQPGMALDIRWHDGHIEIEPAPLVVNLRRRGRLLVAVPDQTVPALAAAVIEQTRDDLRKQRGAVT
jgi:AbrB family looped-hinge helix DNA binding protein